MALFIGVHTVQDDMGGGWEGYKAAASARGIKALRSYMGKEKKMAYCVTEADSADQIHQAHADAKVPIDDVFEVALSE